MKNLEAYNDALYIYKTAYKTFDEQRKLYRLRLISDEEFIKARLAFHKAQEALDIEEAKVK